MEELTEQNNTEEQISVAKRPERHHRKPEDSRGKLFILRQIFNIIFMIVAIAGVVAYLVVDNQTGIILILIAMAFKMAECVLRFIKK